MKLKKIYITSKLQNGFIGLKIFQSVGDGYRNINFFVRVPISHLNNFKVSIIIYEY